MIWSDAFSGHEGRAATNDVPLCICIAVPIWQRVMSHSCCDIA